MTAFALLVGSVGAASLSFLGSGPVATPVRGLMAQRHGTAPVGLTAASNGVVLEPVDGGADFYGSLGATKAVALDQPTFFPIGIWYPSLNSASDVATYESLGINMLDRPDQYCNLSLLAGTGIYAIPQYGECGGATGSGIGNESVGLFTDDEVDMNYGPGAGYTYLQNLINAVPASLKSGRFFWSNYGKGVQLWETTAQAAEFVNDYQQTVSEDLYWYTDPSSIAMCAAFYVVAHCTNDQARRGSNYGSIIDAIRRLEHPTGSEPIWAFVEDGQPFPGDGRFMTPAEMNWAIWSSIIHGHAGIILTSTIRSGGGTRATTTSRTRTTRRRGSPRRRGPPTPRSGPWPPSSTTTRPCTTSPPLPPPRRSVASRRWPSTTTVSSPCSPTRATPRTGGAGSCGQPSTWPIPGRRR